MMALKSYLTTNDNNYHLLIKRSLRLDRISLIKVRYRSSDPLNTLHFTHVEYGDKERLYAVSGA